MPGGEERQPEGGPYGGVAGHLDDLADVRVAEQRRDRQEEQEEKRAGQDRLDDGPGRPRAPSAGDRRTACSRTHGRSGLAHAGIVVTSGVKSVGTALGSSVHPGTIGVNAPPVDSIACPSGERSRSMNSAPRVGFGAFRGTVTENKIGAAATVANAPVEEMIVVDSFA